MMRLCLTIVVAGFALLLCAALAYAECGPGCKHDAPEKPGPECKEGCFRRACEVKGEDDPEYTGVVESVDAAKGEFTLKVDGTGDVVAISLGGLDPDTFKEGQDLRVIYKKQEANVAQRIIKRRHLILPKPCTNKRSDGRTE